MAAIEEGRICIITSGRREGEKIVVMKVEQHQVTVKDKKGKERTVSIKHLNPTDKKA
ncbi:hypothetical protein KKF81_03380 [Candidatus Micrarchaeota archaeon]|nr:hypothetical protein [Candidatus Micrarchaeota archaeon]MBU1165965.1 hypothetical protein [Candidatus Micrarchaeota archaeon]MBU1886869.1 hypothetical protein [Candidatus Micrarchaeota archaeon]